MCSFHMIFTGVTLKEHTYSWRADHSDEKQTVAMDAVLIIDASRSNKIIFISVKACIQILCQIIDLISRWPCNKWEYVQKWWFKTPLQVSFSIMAHSLYIIRYVLAFSCYFTAVWCHQRIVTEEHYRNQMEIHIWAPWQVSGVSRWCWLPNSENSSGLHHSEIGSCSGQGSWESEKHQGQGRLWSCWRGRVLWDFWAIHQAGDKSSCWMRGPSPQLRWDPWKCPLEETAARCGSSSE